MTFARCGDRLALEAPAFKGANRFDGRIAQLVEQLTLNQRVHSSSLCAPTIKSKTSVKPVRAAKRYPVYVSIGQQPRRFRQPRPGGFHLNDHGRHAPSNAAGTVGSARPTTAGSRRQCRSIGAPLAGLPHQLADAAIGTPELPGVYPFFGKAPALLHAHGSERKDHRRLVNAGQPQEVARSPLFRRSLRGRSWRPRAAQRPVDLTLRRDL